MKITHEQVTIGNLFYKRNFKGSIPAARGFVTESNFYNVTPLACPGKIAVTPITSKSLDVLNFPSSSKEPSKKVKS